MGLLVDGQWRDEWYDTQSTGGRFERSAAQFRNWVTADGRPDRMAEVVSRPRPAAITCRCPWPAPGHTAR